MLGEWFLGVRPYVQLYQTWKFDGLFDAAVRLNMRANTQHESETEEGDNGTSVEKKEKREKESKKEQNNGNSVKAAGAELAERLERVDAQLNKQEVTTSGKQEKMAEIIADASVPLDVIFLKWY